mmetsp:Transcript_17077/g.45183  ORF Transcript_17077/g.45183 Transcript_17077/m.45183 type:complete len:321 (+) Transcript_17077:232-1194(+)
MLSLSESCFFSAAGFSCLASLASLASGFPGFACLASLAASTACLCSSLPSRTACWRWAASSLALSTRSFMADSSEFSTRSKLFSAWPWARSDMRSTSAWSRSMRSSALSASRSNLSSDMPAFLCASPSSLAATLASFRDLFAWRARVRALEIAAPRRRSNALRIASFSSRSVLCSASAVSSTASLASLASSSVSTCAMACSFWLKARWASSRFLLNSERTSLWMAPATSWAWAWFLRSASSFPSYLRRSSRSPLARAADSSWRFRASSMRRASSSFFSSSSLFLFRKSPDSTCAMALSFWSSSLSGCLSTVSLMARRAAG